MIIGRQRPRREERPRMGENIPSSSSNRKIFPNNKSQSPAVAAPRISLATLISSLI
jgi:hypothetical protein